MEIPYQRYNSSLKDRSDRAESGYVKAHVGAAHPHEKAKLSIVRFDLTTTKRALCNAKIVKCHLLCVSLVPFLLIWNTMQTISTKNRSSWHKDTKKLKSQSRQTNSGYKPQFILHIGPPKTATTSIQCEFIYNAKLLGDHSPYRYIGKWKTDDCQGPVHEISYLYIEPGTGNELGNISEVVYSNLEESNSPIYSNEEISQSLISTNHTQKNNFLELAKQLKQDGHDFKLLATYRRYFEWVPSYYFEHMISMLSRGRTIRSRTFHYYGVCFVSFQSYLQNHHLCRKMWDFHKMDLHPIQMLQKNSSEFFNDMVHIFNMHDQIGDEGDLNDILYRFANKTLDRSLGFQLELKAGHGYLMPPLHTSAMHRVSREYIAIMVNIYKMGLIHEKTRPNFLWNWLLESHGTIQMLFFGNGRADEASALSLPETCLHESFYNQLLALSLKFEREIYPEWSKGQTDLHREEFHKFVKRRKYCQWDADAIMKNEAVVRFISENVPPAWEKLLNEKEEKRRKQKEKKAENHPRG